MPWYDYECLSCGKKIELFHSIKDDPKTKCTLCGKNKLTRLISGATSLVFKGSGFYVTDNKKHPAGDAAARAGESSKGESGAAAPAQAAAPAASTGGSQSGKEGSSGNAAKQNSASSQNS